MRYPAICTAFRIEAAGGRRQACTWYRLALLLVFHRVLGFEGAGLVASMGADLWLPSHFQNTLQPSRLLLQSVK